MSKYLRVAATLMMLANQPQSPAFAQSAGESSVRSAGGGDTMPSRSSFERFHRPRTVPPSRSVAPSLALPQGFYLDDYVQEILNSPLPMTIIESYKASFEVP